MKKLAIISKGININKVNRLSSIKRKPARRALRALDGRSGSPERDTHLSTRRAPEAL